MRELNVVYGYAPVVETKIFSSRDNSLRRSQRHDDHNQQIPGDKRTEDLQPSPSIRHVSRYDVAQNGDDQPYDNEEDEDEDQVKYSHCNYLSTESVRRPDTDGSPAARQRAARDGCVSGD
jgi:hypothetical protein